MWRTSNTYLFTAGNQQFTVGWDPEAGPNFLGYLANITTSVDFRDSSMARSQQDGLVVADTYLAGRSVALDIRIIDSDPVQRAARLRKIGELAASARVSDCEISWTEDDGSYRRVIGRLVTSPALTHEDGAPTKNVQLSFLCRQPLIEGQPFQLIQEPDTAFLADHVGNATANPKVTFFGPGTAFSLSWGSSVTTVVTTLLTGETITLDSFNKTCVKNGNQPAFAALTTASEFPLLTANSSTAMEFQVENGDSSSAVSVEWRPAWLF